ncbi:hypothetical protein [Microbacterium sp. NPDC079995]
MAVNVEGDLAARAAVLARYRYMLAHTGENAQRACVVSLVLR